MQKGRIALLAGLASATIFGLAAVPSGARVVCPPGTHKLLYCSRQITVRVIVRINFRTFPPTVTVIVRVTDPHVTITLWHKGKQIRTIFDGDYSGTKTFRFTAPRKPGVYTIKTVASSPGLKTETVNKTFRVPRMHHKANHQTVLLPANTTKTIDVPYPNALKFRNAKYSCSATVSGLGKRFVRILSHGSAMGGSVCRVRARNTAKIPSIDTTAKVHVTASTTWFTRT